MALSTYRLLARPVLLQRNRLIDFDACGAWLGLLTSCPTPEGSGIHEIDTTGYSRRRIVLGPAPGPAGVRSPRSLGVIAFALPAVQANASHGGIFDDAGNLLAYGWLQITGGDDPDSIVFPPSEVQIEYH